MSIAAPETPTAPAWQPAPPAGRSPSRPSPARKFPSRSVVAVLFAGVVCWWLFFADTAANNDLGDAFTTFRDGVGELPALFTSGAGYRSWWEYVNDTEGWGSVGRRVLEHVQLVGTSMAIATLVSIVLGVAAHRVPALRSPLLGIASTLLTIPSLALFAIFISISFIGIGDRGPIIALVLYSVLPILRNTLTGLEGVDRAIIESAQGMGLSPVQRLLRIELPLAWPVILTGVRVATLLNIGIAAIAPLVGGSGLGGYIRDGIQRYPNLTSVERTWTGVVFTIALAIAVDALFNLLRRMTTSRGLRT